MIFFQKQKTFNRNSITLFDCVFSDGMNCMEGKLTKNICIDHWKHALIWNHSFEIFLLSFYKIPERVTNREQLMALLTSIFENHAHTVALLLSLDAEYVALSFNIIICSLPYINSNVFLSIQRIIHLTDFMELSSVQA